MLIVKIKICGITNYEDAAAAIEMGADLLGFNFYPKSPRYITPAKAAEIIKKLPGFIDIAGVFVNATFDKIRKTMEQCQLNWIQLHGDEDPMFCRMFLSLDVKTMKALRVKNRKDIERADDFFTDAILLDAFSSEKYGGTGKTFDWSLIDNLSKRIFVAGGITPENATAAVEQ